MPSPLAQRFDAVVQDYFPAWAAKRNLKRYQAEVYKRSYEAVNPNSRLRAPNPFVDAGDANYANTIAGLELAKQARYLEQNDPYAKSILDTLVTKTIGTGLLVKPTAKLLDGSPAEELNAQLTKLHKAWAKRPDVSGELSYSECQRLAFRSMLRDGGYFSQFITGNIKGLTHSSTVQLSLNYLEYDLCPIDVNIIPNTKSSSKIKITVPSGNKVIQGIEFDSFGRVVAYHFYKNHPGDTLAAVEKNVELIRVDTVDVAHGYLIERIKQTRGVSIFHAVLNLLKDVKEYKESETVAARIAAAMVFQIRRDVGMNPNDAHKALEKTTRDFSIKPGMLFDGLLPGEQAEILSSDRPNPNLKGFLDTQLRGICAGTYSAFSSVSKDYLGGSYSSQRQEANENRASILELRQIFINQHNQPIYQRFVEMCDLQGLIVIPSNIDLDTLFDADFRGPGMERIDAKAEADANIQNILAGLKSKTEIILENGGDPEEVNAQINAERKFASESGLLFSSNLADVNSYKQTTPVNNAQNTVN